jgi:hypothetical protein
MIDFNLTIHAAQRLQERFPQILVNYGYDYLLSWTREEPLQGFRGVFYKLCEESVENKSLINDQIYMAKYYDLYGYDSQFCFLEHQKHDVLLVLCKRNARTNRFNLVTVMPGDFKLAKKRVLPFKRSHKQKEAKQDLMQEYSEMKKESVLVRKFAKALHYEHEHDHETLFQELKNEWQKCFWATSQSTYTLIWQARQYEVSWNKQKEEIEKIISIKKASDEDYRLYELNKQLSSEMIFMLKEKLKEPQSELIISDKSKAIWRVYDDNKQYVFALKFTGEIILLVVSDNDPVEYEIEAVEPELREAFVQNRSIRLAKKHCMMILQDKLYEYRISKTGNLYIDSVKTIV